MGEKVNRRFRTCKFNSKMETIRLNIHKQEIYKNSWGWNGKVSQKAFHFSKPTLYGKYIKEKGKLLKDMKENFENQDFQILKTKNGMVV